MLVRLTKKLAEVINGVDLSHCAEGDVIEVAVPHAEMLIAERWAEPVSQEEIADCTPQQQKDAAGAADHATGHHKPHVAA